MKIEGGDVLGAFHKQQIISEVKGFMHELQEGLNDRGKPAKTLPMRPEWVKEWKELQDISAQHDAIERKHRTQKEYFWAIVHKGLDDFRDMRYNEKTKEIEIYDSKNDDDDE